MPGLKDIARRAGIDDSLAKRFIDTIGVALEEGERVTLRGLGSFTPEQREARTFKTPVMNGGETLKPAHIAVRFRSSSVLERRLNPTDAEEAG